MAKVTITTLGNLENQVTAVSTINNNFLALQAIVELLVSRDGTAPNTALADLDFNNFRILNLPQPVQPTEPARLVDLSVAQVYTNLQVYVDQTTVNATNAATSETNAAASETNAGTSATNAATSEANAATSEANAALTLNAFNSLVTKDVITISERTVAEASVAGKGKFWVKDSTPNVAMFTDDAGTDLVLGGGGGGLTTGAPDILIQDQKASTTNGGDAVASVWSPRVLNTIVYDPNSLAVLAGNQLTLSAGTYYVKWDAPMVYTSSSMSRLYNVTGSAVLLTGVSTYSGGGTDICNAGGEGLITVAASQAVELQYFATLAQVTYGLGRKAGIASTPELYTSLRLWKI